MFVELDVKERAKPRFVQIVVLSVVVSLAHGCGESHPPTYPVSGQVVFQDGSTLKKGGWVQFISAEGSPPIKADGFFGPDGKFQLTTFNKNDGAIAGEHKVAVFPDVPDDREPGMSEAAYVAALHPLADRFQNPEGSGLRFKVSAETSPHEFRIEVTPPRRRR